MKRPPAPVYGDIDTARAAIASAAPERVVIARGCFDPLHAGHVRHLAAARALGDFLVVALRDDESVRALRGEVVTQASDRATVLAGAGAVDAVLIFGGDLEMVLSQLRPAVLAVGPHGPAAGEADACRSLGVETAIAGGPKAHDSREILRRIRERSGA